MDEMMASRPVTARSRARVRSSLARRPSTALDGAPPLLRSPEKTSAQQPVVFFERQELQRRRFEYGMRMPFLVSQPPVYGAGLIPSGVYTMVPPELIQTKKQIQSRMLSDPKLTKGARQSSQGERRKSRELHILEEATMKHAGFKHVAKEIEKNRQKYRLKWRLRSRAQAAKTPATAGTWRKESKAGCSYWVNDQTREVRTLTPRTESSEKEEEEDDDDDDDEDDVNCSARSKEDDENKKMPSRDVARRRTSLGGSDYSQLIQALDEAFETTGTSRIKTNDDFCLGTGALTYDPAPCTELLAHLDSLDTIGS